MARRWLVFGLLALALLCVASAARDKTAYQKAAEANMQRFLERHPDLAAKLKGRSMATAGYHGGSHSHHKGHKGGKHSDEPDVIVPVKFNALIAELVAYDVQGGDNVADLFVLFDVESDCTEVAVDECKAWGVTGIIDYASGRKTDVSASADAITASGPWTPGEVWTVNVGSPISRGGDQELTSELVWFGAIPSGIVLDFSNPEIAFTLSASAEVTLDDDRNVEAVLPFWLAQDTLRGLRLQLDDVLRAASGTQPNLSLSATPEAVPEQQQQQRA